MTPEVIDAAVQVARVVGYLNLTRALLAKQLDKPAVWVKNHVKLQDLRDYLHANAGSLDLKPGEAGATGAERTGVWASHIKKAILDAAYAIFESEGYEAVTRDAVAKRANVGAGTVNLRWGSIAALRAEVMREADRRGKLQSIMLDRPVIAG